MGVPSYFAYIIKNHSQIIKKIISKQINHEKFERLYMDCNSILYDCFRDINKPENYSEDEFYNILLEKTKQQIEKYIQQIQPTKILFIAFDGVAPFAKMEQQRNRRYKSWFQSSFISTLENGDRNPTTESHKISTSMFTPGTKFMQRLSDYMTTAFLGQEERYKIQQILLATPRDPGEGEHKLYEHMRNHPTESTHNNAVAVYGLDADLIMLSLFHISYCPKLYVFREAPEFMKSSLQFSDKQHDTKDESLLSKELWGLDIAQLGRSIANEMACSYPDSRRMYDYVFLCFLLGNDFLPHFPALNIRTQGIQRLLDTYRQTIGSKPNCFLLSKHENALKIQWKEFGRFVMALSNNETIFIRQEYATRRKWDYLQQKYMNCVKDPTKIQKMTTKEIDEMIQNAPVIFREEEDYICPQEPGWEQRYYTRFFNLPKHNNIRDIVTNYLEGLEWVCKYYTSGCPDWRWKYKYNYPPLLRDLAPMIPYQNEKQFFVDKNCGYATCAVSPYVQLAYVLPKNQLNLLPQKQQKILLEKYAYLYPNEHLKFKWAFCRYLWESHICFPEESELKENMILELERDLL